ncbi:MAG: hypothetical protein HY401_04570 [Elusimicrobia bacterium]|nr:hypothetical protein [Elusimicrobiota bacterium]
MKRILSPYKPLFFTLLTVNLAWSGPLSTLIKQGQEIGNEFTQDSVEQPKSIAIDSAQPIKSYEELILNNDGSVTIVEPRFKNPNGQGYLPISSTDLYGYNRNLKGVCKLFGFKGPQGRASRGDEEITVIIDSKGKIKGFSRKNASSYNYRVSALICEKDIKISPEKAAPEERAEAVYRNDDGTITLYRPYALGPKNSKLPIYTPAYDNSAYPYYEKIVCKYFGYKKSRTSTLKRLGPDEPRAWVVSDYEERRSRLAGLWFGKDWNYSPSVFESLVCENRK